MKVSKYWIRQIPTKWRLLNFRKLFIVSEIYFKCHSVNLVLWSSERTCLLETEVLKLWSQVIELTLFSLWFVSTASSRLLKRLKPKFPSFWTKLLELCTNVVKSGTDGQIGMSATSTWSLGSSLIRNTRLITKRTSNFSSRRLKWLISHLLRL